MGLLFSYEEIPTAEAFYIQQGDGLQRPSHTGVSILYFELRASIHPFSCFSTAPSISSYAMQNELVLLKERLKVTCCHLVT